MNLVLVSSIGLIAWSLLLGLVVINYRAFLWLKGENKLIDFKSGIEHGSPLYWRINRAQINAAENLAIFALTVFIIYQFGQPNALIGQLSLVYLVARILQSLIHISGNTETIVFIRASFLVTQYSLLAIMLYLGLA